MRQKEKNLTARRDSYVSYMVKYPLYSTLLVLEEYEGKELYEECAIIRDAITEYRIKHGSELPRELIFPTSIKMYRGKAHQDMLEKLDIVIEDKLAKEKAKLIKINLPV